MAGPRIVQWAGLKDRKALQPGKELEGQLQPELDDARIVDDEGFRTKPATRSDVGIASASINGQTELRVVEEVKELRPEIETHVFPGQLELLDDGEVGVDEVRPVDWGAVGVSKLAIGREGKRARVKPVLDGVNPCWRHATGISGDRSSFVGIANDIGPNQAGSVGLEIGAGSEIGTIHD